MCTSGQFQAEPASSALSPPPPPELNERGRDGGQTRGAEALFEVGEEEFPPLGKGESGEERERMYSAKRDWFKAIRKIASLIKEEPLI